MYIKCNKIYTEEKERKKEVVAIVIIGHDYNWNMHN